MSSPACHGVSGLSGRALASSVLPGPELPAGTAFPGENIPLHVQEHILSSVALYLKWP